MKYLIWHEDRPQGPFDENAILDLLKQGTVTRETLLSPEGGQDGWFPLQEVFPPDLFPEVANAHGLPVPPAALQPAFTGPAPPQIPQVIPGAKRLNRRPVAVRWVALGSAAVLFLAWAALKTATPPGAESPKTVASRLVRISRNEVDTYPPVNAVVGAPYALWVDITNGSAYNVQDIEVTWVHRGHSGTVLGRTTKTFYEVLSPGVVSRFYLQSPRLPEQSASSEAFVTGFSATEDKAPAIRAKMATMLRVVSARKSAGNNTLTVVLTVQNIGDCDLEGFSAFLVATNIPNGGGIHPAFSTAETIAKGQTCTTSWTCQVGPLYNMAYKGLYDAPLPEFTAVFRSIKPAGQPELKW